MTKSRPLSAGPKTVESSMSARNRTSPQSPPSSPSAFAGIRSSGNDAPPRLYRRFQTHRPLESAVDPPIHVPTEWSRRGNPLTAEERLADAYNRRHGEG